MSFPEKNIGLYTDHYELTMAQGYFLSGKQNETSYFDYFFRKNPFGGGYVVFAGLENLLEILEKLKFEEDDCIFLHSIGFDSKFIEFLRGFKFTGNVFAVREGEVVFPNEPVVRIEGNIIECQLVESLLLNILNFQSLIATKSSRMKYVAGNKLLIDFGLRRAQGFGAIHASRAAIIGGVSSTSNTYSAFHFNLKSTGTMAHSWVQAFGDESDAFFEFAKYFPNSSVLLLDTYSTLQGGIVNAIKVAKYLEIHGSKLVGVRLDSGDLNLLSKAVRKELDEAQLGYVKVFVSNQLDEYAIKNLRDQNAPIDAFGVGTALVTGKDEAALDGVYKLVEINHKPSLKISDNISKMTLPGIKSIYRYLNPNNNTFYADGIELAEKGTPKVIYHVNKTDIQIKIKELECEKIIERVMLNGKRMRMVEDVYEISRFSQKRIHQLPDSIKRLNSPQTYKVGLGISLIATQELLKQKLWKRY